MSNEVKISMEVLSIRALTAIYYLARTYGTEITLLSHLAQFSEKQLMNNKGFGRKTLNEIKELLHDNGFYLIEECPPNGSITTRLPREVINQVKQWK